MRSEPLRELYNAKDSSKKREERCKFLGSCTTGKTSGKVCTISRNKTKQKIEIGDQRKKESGGGEMQNEGEMSKIQEKG